VSLYRCIDTCRTSDTSSIWSISARC